VSVAGASQLRLVVTDGGDGVGWDHADWAAARIECAGDTTPPIVSSTSPANAATGVAVGTKPAATFSKAMDPTTLTTSTFTLVKQGATTPIGASVSYDATSRTATLSPVANLDPDATYTATVKGGSGGSKDLAGNALASDAGWSFTTAAANQPPAPVIDAPAPTLTWKVGDLIGFSGQASDPEQGTLPASALTWGLIMHHCPTSPNSCHTHFIQSFNGVASGTFNAPDHDYPSWLELQLTATDSAGASATTSVRLDPKTVDLGFASVPSGLSLAVGPTASVTPFTRTFIVNSITSISAASLQTLAGTSFNFGSWSDAGAATHNMTTPATATTYTANYTAATSSSSYLSDLSWTSMSNGWGPVEKDLSNGEQSAGDGRTLALNGQTFAKGLGAHAASDVRYNLGGSCSRFKASVGVDDEAGLVGSVGFQVYADATKVFDSGVMTGASVTQPVDVSVAGASQLRLVVTDGGDGVGWDHADWAAARIEC
jgi:NPCBM/NEW2 domain-containing protein/Big-like domain-containing protein